LGCAYVERFHNKKIKAFFRDAVYGENRERIVTQWVLSKVPCSRSLIEWLFGCSRLADA